MCKWCILWSFFIPTGQCHENGVNAHLVWHMIGLKYRQAFTGSGEWAMCVCVSAGRSQRFLSNTNFIHFGCTHGSNSGTDSFTHKINALWVSSIMQKKVNNSSVRNLNILMEKLCIYIELSVILFSKFFYLNILVSECAESLSRP